MKHSPRLDRQHDQSVAKPPKTIRRERKADNNEQTSSTLSNVREVLDELHTLLADHSPTWFTQEHFERTEKALRRLNVLLPSR
jgi:hypothetical protein